MNKIIKHSLLSVACLASALAFTSCDTDVESLDIDQPGIAQQNPQLYKTYLANIKAYKQNSHKLMLVGFNNSEKLPYTQGQHINAVPDSADYVILSNPEAVNEREIKEMSEIRENKGIKSLYTINFDEIKSAYDKKVSEFEAEKKAEIQILDDQKVAGTITDEAYTAKVKEINARTYVSFNIVLTDSVTTMLSYCDRFGFDGVIMSFRGKEKVTMTEGEKAVYTAWENMFLGIAKDWAERNTTKELMLQGKMQMFTDQSIFAMAKLLLVPCQDASSMGSMGYCMLKAAADGVPNDKLVPVVETTSMDKTDKATGWWANNVYASLGAARFVVSEHTGYNPAGLCVLNIQNDYYNAAFVYPHVRTAISIMNPTVKN